MLAFLHHSVVLPWLLALSMLIQGLLGPGLLLCMGCQDGATSLPGHTDEHESATCCSDEQPASPFAILGAIAKLRTGSEGCGCDKSSCSCADVNVGDDAAITASRNEAPQLDHVHVAHVAIAALSWHCEQQLWAVCARNQGREPPPDHRWQTARAVVRLM